MNLWLDTETYAPIPINAGVGAYSVEAWVMIVTYAIDDGPVGVWDLTQMQPVPADLYDALHDDAVTITCHNSFFDRTMLNACRIGGRTYPVRRFRCTMAQAYAHGLPGALGTLCEILGVGDEHAKKDGKDLIHLFCKPRLNDKPRATYRTHPEEWERFVEYAIRDTDAMREVSRKLPRWNYPNNKDELESWFLDQGINDRGVLMDLELCRAAVRATDKAKAKLARQTKDQTDGYVDRATQRDKLLAYILLEYNVELPDMRASTLDRRLDDPELPESVKELLRVRLESAMNSQTKYKKVLRAASPDGRVRGMLQWCGASRTGRQAGRIVQPQNLPRPSLKQDVIERGIRALKLGAEDLICT